MAKVKAIRKTDEFDAWKDLTGAALKDRLAAFFDPGWPLSLGPGQVDAIRTILHPEVEVPRTPNQIAVGSAVRQLGLPEEEGTPSRMIRSMDFEQERQARTIGASPDQALAWRKSPHATVP